MVLDCPHCRSERVGFEFGGERRDVVRDKVWNTLFVCRNCREGVVIKLENKKGYRSHPGECTGDPCDQGYVMLKVHPKPLEISAPEHVPDAMARDYKEASDSLQRGKSTSAGMMFRKVLQRATTEIGPDSNTFKKKGLKARIESLAKLHLLTPAMAEWADFLRDEGNDATHEEEEEFTQPQAQQMQEFTELFLLYAFTLPGRVAEAREKTEDNEPSDSS